MSTTSNLSQLDRELNELILAGQAMDAFERFYADDVIMQENTEAPCIGKAANREREVQFFSAIEQFHGASMHSSIVGDDVSMSEWTFDCTLKGGQRYTVHQVARRRWKEGRVVHERFYYSKA
jgi:hypothetical protein